MHRPVSKNPLQIGVHNCELGQTQIFITYSIYQHFKREAVLGPPIQKVGGGTDFGKIDTF